MDFTRITSVAKVSDQMQLPFANPDIRKYFAEAETGSTDIPEWARKPELPSPEEILGTGDEASNESIDLYPNLVGSPWPSKDVYLNAHYSLLREDAVAPLRDAVAYVRETPGMMDSQDVSIYEKVHITGLTFAQRGLGFRVQFSANRAGKNIVWEYSKRLISGTIVALSPADDCFQRICIMAVVAARPLDGVKKQPPEVDLFFARAEDAQFDPQQEFVMVESRTGYYESLRHTMTALQKMARESFPLSKHIVHLDPNVGAPKYVEEKPEVDLSHALRESEIDGKVNILEAWPKLSSDDLDPSQSGALRHMLTRKLAIVQGPPGTGKTFVSVIALKAMLGNMSPHEPPIVIASQTNHALDQLLRHVSEFESNYIRLGGRSTDSKVKKRTLYEVRLKEGTSDLRGGLLAPGRTKIRTLASQITRLLEAFEEKNAHSPLSASFFLEHGFLTKSQFEALEQGAKGWVTTDAQGNDPLRAWLGDQVSKLDVKYTTENFGFEEDEVDLEYEQLKELEAEQGIDDDEYDGLHGQRFLIKEGFVGIAAPSFPGKNITKYLNSRDFWQIPATARGAVYNALRKLAKEKILVDLRKLLHLYYESCELIKVGKWERDWSLLRNARVIGMTTTGMSKYRGIISAVEPKIVLVEEAAEVLEAPISACCIESLQQLILVGDHKQLTGTCSVPELAGEPFFLEMSMFERLINNGIKHKILTRQRRMAPEIRRLIEPIYGELKDHPSVTTRPRIPGMGKYGSYFFNHTWLESSDSLFSKFNEKEALMVAEFFVYLVLNRVPVKDITVLTFYNGQRKRLLRLLKNHAYLQGNYVNVVTVDAYQGEENEVVILSTVRSGTKHNIGFLDSENRACVAMSRAKRGLYIFGNAELLASQSGLWRDIVNIMAKDKPEARRIGFHLPLTCRKHHVKTFIKEPSQWSLINGGCAQECGDKLPCGHECGLKCHSFSHDKASCNQRCVRPLTCGHLCIFTCSAPHICHCKCPEFAEWKASKNPAEDQTSKPTSQTRVPSAEEPRQTIIEENPEAAPIQVPSTRELREKLRNDYQAFAMGGAKEEDALIAARAEKAREEYMRKHFQEMARKDFLTGHGEDNQGQSVKLSPVKSVSDGKDGSRKRFTETYTADPVAIGSLAKEVPEGSLIDFNDN